MVKAEIAVKHAQQVTRGDGGGMLALQLLQPLDILVADGKWNDADRHHFQLFAYRVNFLHLQRGKATNQRAAIWNALHQAFLFEFEQRQPHVTAMGLEQVGKILLDQPLFRLAPPQHDVLLEAFGNHDGGGPARQRWRYRPGFGRAPDRAFGWLSYHTFPGVPGRPPPSRPPSTHLP